MRRKMVIRRRLPKAVIVFGALYCAGISIHGAMTIGLADALSGRAIIAVGAPAALALLLALALRLRRPARINLALVLASVGVAVFLFESYLTVMDPKSAAFAKGKELRLNAARADGRPVDPRTRLEVVRDLRAQGVDAVPPVGGGGHFTVAEPSGRVLPILAGVSMARTVLCGEAGQYIIYDADEHGFNNPHGLHERAPLHAALLGDSYTHGDCVLPEASIAGHVRAVFPATLNLGVRGTGPLHQFATFREYAAPLRPRFVVWNWFEGNDLRDLNRELTWVPLRDYLATDAPFGLKNWQADVDRTLRAAIDTQMHQRTPSWLIDFLLLRSIRHRLGLAAGEYVSDENRASKVQMAIAEGIFTAVRDAVQSWGGELIVVYLPASARYCGKVPAWREYCAFAWTQYQKGWLDHRDDMLAIFARLGLPIVDGHAAFADTGRPEDMFYFGGSHYSPEGYRVVAEALLQVLKTRLTASAESTLSEPLSRQ